MFMVKEFLNDGPRYQLYRAELSEMLGDCRMPERPLGQ
jgi:hypothetical protein